MKACPRRSPVRSLKIGLRTVTAPSFLASSTSFCSCGVKLAVIPFDSVASHAIVAAAIILLVVGVCESMVSSRLGSSSSDARGLASFQQAHALDCGDDQVTNQIRN